MNDNTRQISKSKAMASMLHFLRGTRPRYFFGMIFYSSQMFLSSLLSSILMGSVSAAMLNKSINGVYKAGAGYLAAALVYFVILGLGTYFYVISLLHAQKAVKKALFSSFVYTSMEDRAIANGGIAAINTEADTALNSISNSLAAFLSCFSAILLSAVTIFILDWRLGIVSLGAGLLALVIQSLFAKPMENVAKSKLDANSTVISAMSGILSGSAAIRAFSLQERMAGLFDKENLKLLGAAYKETRLRTLQNAFTNLQSWLSLASVLGIGGWLVISGKLSFSTLIMVPTMCMSLGMGLSGIGSAWAQMQTPLEAAARVNAMLNRSKKITDAENNRKPVIWDKNSDIQIKNLSFKYEGVENNSLNSISLEIKSGEMVAFVGESGCGKSTLLKVIAGLYERGEQAVFIGNMQLGTAPSCQWRENFSLVDQSCKLFDMSIEKNIMLGRRGASAQDAVDAAKEAGAYDFITELDEGFNTACGESGAKLSGGQKQRIAIARALCRKAPVLMLDEATAALDSQSQKFLMQTVESLRESHTIIVVTHDLRQIVNADKIVVLKNGSVVQQGKHDELLLSGEYHRLWHRNQEEN